MKPNPRTGVKYQKKKAKEKASMALVSRVGIEGERFEFKLLLEHLKGKLEPEALKELRGLMAETLKSLRACSQGLRKLQEKYDKDIYEYDLNYRRKVNSRTVPLAEKRALNQEYIGYMLKIQAHYQKNYLLLNFMRNQLFGVKGERALKKSLDADLKDAEEYIMNVAQSLFELKEDKGRLERF